MSGGSKIASTVDIAATVFHPGRIIPVERRDHVEAMWRAFHWGLDDEGLDDDRKTNPNKHAAYWIKQLVDNPEDNQ